METPDAPAIATEKDVRRVRHAVIVIAAAALIALLAAGRAIVLPILFAALIALVLCPLTRRLQRRGVPVPITALLLLALVVTTASWGVSAMSEPLSAYTRKVPHAVEQLRTEAARWGKFLTHNGGRSVSIDQVRVRDADKPRIDAERLMSAATMAMPRVRDAIIRIGVTLVLTYFMLIGGRQALRTAIALIRTPGTRRRAMRWSETVQVQLSRYLLTVISINVGMGAGAALILTLCGVPSAIFLGALACILNFIPFLGALLATGLLAFAAFTTPDLIAPPVMVPIAYFGLHLLEAEFVTPWVLGRTLTLNPLFVILAVLVFGTLWGIGGAFLAVPLLVVAKVSFASAPGFPGWSQVLGRRRLELRSAQQAPTLVPLPVEPTAPPGP